MLALLSRADETMTSNSESMAQGRETGTLGKLMVLLDLVTHADAPLRFTDILARAGQPRGTLHRQLSHLVEEGLLELDGDGRYAPGLRLLDFAARSWARNEFRLIAEPHLAELQQATGETVHLGVLRGQSIIYLDKVDGRQPVRMYSQIGNASPCYCTGVGKAALSLLPADLLTDLLAGLSFTSFTASTHVSADSLLAEIREIADQGYAFDREEHEAGIRCVAAPVWSQDRTFIGGISITGPAYRLSMELLRQWAVPVQLAAGRIMEGMRIRLGPRR
ncbi:MULTISPECIES: IclR family transcriptional regulator [Rhizobium]|uniref:IclR family transcriptional regulator n=2 Tax=Rhizobium/Agrobacterium group TaxID=227290 RepID=UPI0007F13F87|nr:IclR family transcriptional regulator protein [Rhizobium sp. N324]ANM15844.1 IclR family transcriptional regulator protein [Rhizobium sp. N541]ANM22232.1 IclR family transcriptional regulator protein [Rhizobium sp. N941]OYD02941.1 IclR family transcriptional regulator protein [Rhizobium sp. N4311]